MLIPETLKGRGSGHLCGMKRSNWGHVDIGFLQRECWFVRNSVIILSNVMFGGCSGAFREVVLRKVSDVI